MTFENGSTQSAVCQVVSMADYVAEKSGGYDLEDGHTRIINTLLDALASAPLTARQYRVLIAIIRKTYGYQKKADRLSVSQLAECTGIHQRHISTTLAELVAMNVIIRKSERSDIAINKYHETWDLTARHEVNEAKKRAFKKVNQGVRQNSPIQIECDETSQIKCDEISQTQKKERNINTSTDVDVSSTTPVATRKKTDCPYQKLLELYQQHFPTKQQPRTLGDRRKRIIKQGWTYAMRLSHSETGLPLYTDTESGIEWWGKFMAWIARKAEFCMKQQHNFSIDWLFTAKAIEGLIDGKYNTVKS